MLTLLEVYKDGKRAYTFKNITEYRVSEKPLEGGGSGVTETGDRITDILSSDVTISATMELLTRDEFEEFNKAVTVYRPVELHYWAGRYITTSVFKVESIDSELQKSEQRPNTEKSNRWNVSVTFTKIK